MTLEEILRKKDWKYQKFLRLTREVRESYIRSLERKGRIKWHISSYELDTTIRLKSVNICPFEKLAMR